MLEKWTHILFNSDKITDGIYTSHIFITDDSIKSRRLLKENVSTIKFRINLEFNEAIEKQILEMVDNNEIIGDTVFLFDEKIEPVEKYNFERKESTGKCRSMKNLLQSKPGWI